jgi:hypothetical protein
VALRARSERLGSRGHVGPASGAVPAQVRPRRHDAEGDPHAVATR